MHYVLKPLLGSQQSRRQEVDHRQAADLLSKMDTFLASFLVSPHVIAAVQVMLIAGCWVQHPGDSSRDILIPPVGGHDSPLNGHLLSPSQKGRQQNCQDIYSYCCVFCCFYFTCSFFLTVHRDLRTGR